MIFNFFILHNKSQNVLKMMSYLENINFLLKYLVKTSSHFYSTFFIFDFLGTYLVYNYLRTIIVVYT